ncbi:terminase small subunit [Rhizobium bangladeshense]|uniref:terminase small subunit n=2 Tax=Rhizobium bangladeshense TaxID=1138189 RepID=UPI002180BA5B|nr:terminase small subunit [Rhizobium bangladeshense]
MCAAGELPHSHHLIRIDVDQWVILSGIVEWHQSHPVLPRKLMTALTDKQARFVAEYLVDLNATQAAIRAGYSRTTAQQQGSRLLLNVVVKAAIAERQEKVAAKLEITQEMIVAELAKIGFANMLDYVSIGADGDPFVSLGGMTRDQAAAVAEVTVEDFKDGRGEDARDVRKIKFKLHDKKAALVDLGKHLGMFKDQVEHTGNITVEVVRFSDEK